MKEIPSSLESLQHEVGGDIEAVYPFEEPVAIVCNEEGKMNGLPLNQMCIRDRDSVATILLAAEKNEPLDEVIYSEVMFDQEISGDVPEHRDFIHQKLKRFVENELGCKFTVLRSDKTYDDVFHHIITRGPYEGLIRGFVWPGKCAVNRDCKIDVYKRQV